MRRSILVGTDPVNTNHSPNMTDPDDAAEAPSRTQQRRDALAVLALATQLTELQPSRLAKLDLPDDVRREVEITRQMTAHGAKKRQMAYLAKIMRRYDDTDFAAVRAELGENRERQRQENAAMHRLESMRDRLVAEDEAALSELIGAHPQLDRQHLRSLLRQARVEQNTPDKPPRAYREIFQLLKDLQAASPSAPDVE